MNKRISLGTAAVSVLAVLACTPGALALDGQDFGNKLAATLAATGMNVTFDSAETSGDTVTFSGVTVTPPGEDAQDVPGKIVFTGVRETPDGGYMADAGKVDDFEVEEDGATVSVENAMVSELSVPAVPASDPARAMTLYRGFSLGPLRVENEGTEVFRLEGIAITNTPNDDLTQFDGTFEMTGMHADLSSVDDEDAKALLKQFDIDALDAHAEGHSHWALDEGKLEITDSALTIDKVGTLSTSATVNGYDRDLLTRLQAAQEEIVESDASGDEASASGEEVLDAMIDKLALGGFSLRFEDDGITGKVLDFFANQQGMPRDVMAAGVSASIPMLLSQFAVPQEFQTMLLTAAQTFLSDPKSLEIRADPATPVKLSEVEGATADPAETIEKLNLSVTANQ